MNTFIEAARYAADNPAEFFTFLIIAVVVLTVLINGAHMTRRARDRELQEEIRDRQDPDFIAWKAAMLAPRNRKGRRS